ncbi:hypothetical protein KDL01_35690 [Actinospica durhamensis]|uniref:Uncharacterized protein n=1 Tax=Actinospica durhamensis TaxID=1508375 RepID=A0A941EWQ5_9ACTN|nr:hypothetical protein [Actinospica durhamensis]MBR7838666.1 hypothetical protein [Actinospica durhamensis]
MLSDLFVWGLQLGVSNVHPLPGFYMCAFAGAAVVVAAALNVYRLIERRRT